MLDLAVGMTRTPVDVSDELFARLRARFDEAQLVELVNEIAVENYRARFDWAFGIGSQGFTEGGFCVRPERPPQAVARRDRLDGLTRARRPGPSGGAPTVRSVPIPWDLAACRRSSPAKKP